MTTIQLPIKILPFEIPSSVIMMSDVFDNQPACSGTFINIPLNKLSYENLDSLCKEFRDLVFKKAEVVDKKPTVYRNFGSQSGSDIGCYGYH